MHIDIKRHELFMISKALECYYEMVEQHPTELHALKDEYQKSMLELQKYIEDKHENYIPNAFDHDINRFMEHKLYTSMQEYKDAD